MTFEIQLLRGGKNCSYQEKAYGRWVKLFIEGLKYKFLFKSGKN